MTDIKRRKFFTMVSAGAAAIPVGALIASLPSHAADLPAVDPSSAQAMALQYVEASEKADQKCAKCALYSGAEGESMGPCPLFPGNVVHAEGWCSAFSPIA